jgi:hypothetical protein
MQFALYAPCSMLPVDGQSQFCYEAKVLDISPFHENGHPGKTTNLHW